MNFENTVVFVDDEIMVLNALKRSMRKEEYNKIYINDPKNVMKIFDEYEVSVIVTDMRMPEIDGLKLLRMVKEKSPDTIRIVLSGYTQLPQVLAALNYGEIYKFITKPWDLEDDFIPTIAEAVEKYTRNKANKVEKSIMAQQNTLYRNLVNASHIKEINIHTEMDRLREVSEDMFDNMIKYISEIEYIEKLEIYRDVQRAYLNAMPMVNIVFDIKKLESEIKLYIEAFNTEKDVKFEIIGERDEVMEIKQKNNFVLIVNIFNLINKYIMKYTKQLDLTAMVKFEKQGKIANINFMKRLEFESVESREKFCMLVKEIDSAISRLGGSIDIVTLNETKYYRFNIKSELVSN